MAAKSDVKHCGKYQRINLSLLRRKKKNPIVLPHLKTSHILSSNDKDSRTKLEQHMKGSPRRQTIQSEILEVFFFLLLKKIEKGGLTQTMVSKYVREMV